MRQTTKAGELVVCDECFGDPALASFVRENATETRCTFCERGARRLIAAAVEDVAAHIQDCLRREYDDAANWLPWESADGGYLGEHWDTYDLLVDEVAIDLPNDDGSLLRALLDGMDDVEWCKNDPFGMTKADQMRFSWGAFCSYIKYRRRFFFRETWRRRPSNRDLLTPRALLDRVAEVCKGARIRRRLTAGASMFRARLQCDGQRFTSADDLGPPPRDCAVKANRMSAPGIVMFYGAANERTAILETVSGPSSFAVGRFELCRDVSVLDLTELPGVPSLFDLEAAHRRDAMRFLHEFVWDLAKPIAHDDRVHVEYVPTQVIAEFIRTKFSEWGRPLAGVSWPSPWKQGGICYALFASQAQVEGTAAAAAGRPSRHGPLLRLRDVLQRTVSQAEWSVIETERASIVKRERALGAS